MEYPTFVHVTANPDAKDRQFVEVAMDRYGISKPLAYSDLSVIKAMLPTLHRQAVISTVGDTTK